PYHAGLADDERQRNQEAFQKDDVDVVVATVAFGMGIDKSNVRFVIHRDMPKDVESWYQEMGRAGRDGLDSDCVLFYSWADVKQHERFLNDIDDPDLWHAKRQATVDLFRIVENGGCRHQAILAHFDEEMAPCGGSCDVCTGEAVAEIAAEAMLAAGALSGGGRGRGRGPSRATGGSTHAAGTRSPAAATPEEQELFERLRTLRKALADSQGVPAYIVFSDKVLREMAARRPSGAAELLAVPGVGPAKLERYGEAFLREIGG
ncbi:MAG TPA: HRDC domain-containing protein, partial [Longimicrobiales bacterium]|nr:HRDC domain-containing protein [Longimicrobiales bacterium]